MPRPLLPHQPPMHWIEDASLSHDGLCVTATARIVVDHPFVENGLLARSALIEYMAQAAASGHVQQGINNASTGATRRLKFGMLAAIRDLEIFQSPRVGEVLTLEATHEKTLGPLAMAHIEGYIGDDIRRLAAKARMTFYLEFE